MRSVLLVNPLASSVTSRNRELVAKTLAADLDVEVAETSHRGHAIDLARKAACDEVACVFVLGGDGTLNEVANGLAGTSTCLAALPGGSTNVFARALGTTKHPVQAAAQLVASLQAGAVRRIGLGSANGRYFLFHVGMGFDAAVVEQVERRAGLKRYASHPLFVYAGFTTWFRHYDHRRPRLYVQVSGEAPVDDAYLAICLNMNPYTYLGPKPLDIAPEADLDHNMVLVSVRTLAFLPMLGVIGSALGVGGPVRSRPEVAYSADVTSATVVGRDSFPYQLDGDYLGKVDRVDLRHEPSVLDLVVPAPD
ncbi:MAG: diacylglycerol kinase family lipid kinase [Actinobacteria bacterium]|nr:diacylglycerol kinase family lipid kinase [Actinomycetota bacterium]